MQPIRRILVPVDFSSHSQVALDYAIGLAKSLGASINLLHCYQVNLAVISPYGPTLPPNFEADLRQAAGEKLREWSEKASGEGIEINEHLKLVFPSEGVVDLAEELGSDLIVMGTRGLSGLKHVVLGSVAERVVRLAPCPVLSLKADQGELMYEFLEYCAEDVMTTELITTRPDAPLAEIEEIFEKHDFNGLPVLGANGELIGVVTKLDLLRAFRFGDDHMFPPYQDIMAKPVQSVMSMNTLSVTPRAPLPKVLEKLVSTGIKSLPVLDGDELVGIVSREDVLGALRQAASGQRAPLLGA